jgi:hypothetical protein
MLYSQAQALQAIFMNAAVRVTDQPWFSYPEAYMRMAVKAQSQRLRTPPQAAWGLVGLDEDLHQQRIHRRAMEGRRPRREARDSPEGALSHCVSLRASDSEVAQVSAGRLRQKESLAARPRVRGGLGCPVAHPEGRGAIGKTGLMRLTR